MAYYKCGSIHPTQNSNVVIDTASGPIANFETPLAIHLPKIQFDFKATQEAGTPTPQSPKAISGVSAVSVIHCHKNLYQYDESKMEVGTTSTSTTRAFMRLGLKGACTLSFSATLKEGETPTAYYINVGKISNGIITLIQTLISGQGITNDLTISFNAGEEIVLVSASPLESTLKSALPKYNIQIEVGSQVTSFEETQINTTLINLGGTYYGGYVTQDKDGKREITVTKGITTLGDLTNWRYAQGSGVWRFQAKMPNNYKLPETISERLNFISSCFKPDLSPTTGGSVDNSIAGYTNDTKVYILCNKYTDLETFLTDLSSQTLVYTLAEPFTIDLPDGTPIKSLPGVNNIFADTGDTSLQFCKIG